LGLLPGQFHIMDVCTAMLICSTNTKDPTIHTTYGQMMNCQRSSDFSIYLWKRKCMEVL